MSSHLKKKARLNDDACSYSQEDIENCVDKEKLLDMYSDLKKEAVENEELLRKLKLVQKHHTKVVVYSLNWSNIETEIMI